MAMPTVDAVAGKGADLNLVGVEFAVSDSAAFAEFNVFAVNNEKFDWTISASGIVVSAMGVSLPGVAMTKVVTLDGFNKLQGLELQSYLINKIDDEGLHMSISATISNPSTIGMTIPSAIFNTISHGAVLGPAVATGMTLVPHGSSSFALNATIQAGHGDLTPYLTGIFQNALSGIASPLTAQGTAAPGVSWLDAAIKSLTIDTALPPLAEPPIEAVTINNMSMDFTCPTCDYAPTTVSSITARTNLPFAMDVPISQLRQNVNILDTNGVLVGTLNTEYSAATATGNLVSTTTGSSPLVIADGAHEVYGDFVKDLTAATTYDLGLQGTADSFLNLGALGTIEVKGIKIDVRTSLKGLQGIKDVTYVTRLAFSIAGQFSMVATLANIHNPSDLTLKIGTLKFVTDPDGIPEHAIGVTEIAALELVPGDNQALSITTIQMSLDYAWPFIANLTSALVEPTPIYLSTDSQISSNPALVAGLSEVSTILLIPPQLPESRSALPYGDTWTIRATPSTADDGIIEIGSTINNPYFNTTLHVDDVAPPYPPEGTTYGDDLVALTLTTSLDPYVNFDVLSSGPFDILPGQSKEIYFKMKPRSLNPTTQFDLAVKLANVFKTGGDGYINIRTLIPDIRLGDNPVAVKALWMSRDVYPATVGFLKARGGADFDYFVQYAQKQIPVAAPAVTTTSGATSPTTIDSTVAPTATDAPTVPTTDSSVNVPSVAPTAPASPAAPSPSIVPTP
ncbi:hypothetical protein BGZ76_004468 [Entomortierella beljakovae]|nr:hypothetical protein BGZ76_004468 [Entomortierella beljakovae]